MTQNSTLTQNSAYIGKHNTCILLELKTCSSNKKFKGVNKVNLDQNSNVESLVMNIQAVYFSAN